MLTNIDQQYYFEEKINELVTTATTNAIKHIQDILNNPKEWMTLSEAAKYAGVSHNTFVKFREMGLKVSQVDGIKRVSRKEIDTFLERHSF
ncbi:helix-turn-helix domain-containing protein [Lysinibacillus sphaericus]|uniref:helix-turn-helix domain-containing protein n=1 Tax=Lysinibacillus sphaericus TaxID=1421 RepID=UPI001CBBE9BE|nr:helix-turn-helix domain-containing protein [Lysinibacillus sphaericus]